MLKVVPCHSLASAWDDVRIHRELLDWAAQYRKDPSGLRSLAVVFEGPGDLSEAAFEAAMWQRIQSFADKDHWLGQPYDHRVSADPDDSHFSLSFGGEAFFVVGLHPNASRPARRFPHPTLVFNLHDQFEKLREQGRYERMREAILARDMELAGSHNPMLARHGDSSEAAQYSGRLTGEDWECPFQDPRAQ
jgi:FPC/CPF motif-containing protein YcgG